MEISEENIAEIADWLDMGMRCFYHKSTGEVEYHPDPIHADFDPEFWEETIEKIENDWDNYVQFEPMNSREAFQIMEDFANSLEDPQFKNIALGQLSRPKPFSNFKFLIDNSDYREDWFAFKKRAYMAWVKREIEERVE